MHTDKNNPIERKRTDVTRELGKNSHRISSDRSEGMETWENMERLAITESQESSVMITGGRKQSVWLVLRGGK